MKYISRELGKPKQFQKLLDYLTAFLNDENTDSTPLDTADTMSKIACYHRMPSEFTENVDCLKLVINFRTSMQMMKKFYGIVCVH